MKRNKLIIKSVFLLILVSSCGVIKKDTGSVFKENTDNINFNTIDLNHAIFYSKLLPSDSGDSLRNYLMFEGDIVYIMRSTVSKEDIADFIILNYGYKSNWLFEKRQVVFEYVSKKMTHTNNGNFEKEFKVKYISDQFVGDLLNFTIEQYWFDGTLFMTTTELYSKL